MSVDIEALLGGGGSYPLLLRFRGRFCFTPLTCEVVIIIVITPKTISVHPYPCNCLVSYTLSLKLFCQMVSKEY